MSHEFRDRLRTLRTIEERLQPDDAWIRATRETLLMQVRNSLPTEQMHFWGQVKHALGLFAPKKIIQFMRGPVVATLSIIAVALGSSVASVSAAERALPGDFLYSLKLATEQARLALTPEKEEKLKLKIEFTSRRGEELKQVGAVTDATRPARVEQAAEILKRDLDTVKQQLDDVKSSASAHNVVEAAKLVDQTSNTLMQQIQATKTDLPTETKDKLTLAQAAAADTGVKAIEVIVEQHKETQDVIPQSEVVAAVQDHTKIVADATGMTPPIATTTALMVAASGTSTEALDQVVQDLKVATQQAFASITSSTAPIFAGASSTITGVATSSTSPISSGTSTNIGTGGSPSSTTNTSQTSTKDIITP